MDVHIWQIIAVFFVSLIASAFSGMAGGGGGFIFLPFLIAVGLGPQQAVATLKLAAFGTSFGSIAAFKRKSFEDKRLLFFLLALTIPIGLFVPHIFKAISSKHFQLVLAVMILAMIPVVLSEKNGLAKRQTNKFKKAVGGVLIAAVFFLQGVFSGGVGSLNNVVLIYFFGLTTLGANAIRRVAVMALNTIVVAALIAGTSFIVYKLAISGLFGGLIGSYIGTRIAIKKGERFAEYALAVFMFVSGVFLILGAK